jgi:hypothetical protein
MLLLEEPTPRLLQIANEDYSSPCESSAASILVIALVVLPALLGCDVEDDVLAVVPSEN